MQSLADQNTGTAAVPEDLQFDEAALARWLKANVAGFSGPLGVE